MHPRVSVRGFVRPSVGCSVGRWRFPQIWSHSEQCRKWATRRKERQGGRSGEEEGATRRKERGGGRSDEEEGTTMRKEQRRGSSDNKKLEKLEKLKKLKRFKKIKKNDHSWPPRSCFYSFSLLGTGPIGGHMVPLPNHYQTYITLHFNLIRLHFNKTPLQ